MLPGMKEWKVREKHITSCLKSWYTDTLCIFNFCNPTRRTVKLDQKKEEGRNSFKVNISSVNMPPDQPTTSALAVLIFSIRLVLTLWPISFTDEMLCLSIILEYNTVYVYFCVQVVLFLFSQGAVIEACTRAVYFVHLFNKTQTFSTFKSYMSIFSYTVSLLSLYVFTNIAMYSVVSCHDPFPTLCWVQLPF